MPEQGALPFKVDVSAKAEARFELHATVPERSMGRLVDALTDIVRPFSESRGLRADQIRLQREDVAMEMALRARQRLMIEVGDIRPVPNKVLVPLIEAASNEEPTDDYMIDMWANLLATAATRGTVEPRFVGILREMHGRQAEAFEAVARNNAEEFERPLAQLEDSPAMLESAFLQQSLNAYFEDLTAAPDAAHLYAMIYGWIERPGAFVIDVIAHVKDQM